MSETLAGTVHALRLAGDAVADAGSRLLASAPGPAAFGAGGPGQLGELGADLYRLWQNAVEARAREAAAHAARLHEAADAVSTAAGGYGDVDEAARRAQPEVG
jgi:hypothetical protein